MTIRTVAAAALLATLAFPLAAQAQNAPAGAAAGAATGAVGGAIVGGPVGAVVGGVAGAAVGGALSQDDSVRVRQYVVREHRPSVRVQERVVVGEPLPRSVEIYQVPAEVGVKTQYRYSVVNGRTVLVDPGTRRVVQIIEE